MLVSDDASASGSPEELKKWWDKLVIDGPPLFGYFMHAWTLFTAVVYSTLLGKIVPYFRKSSKGFGKTRLVTSFYGSQATGFKTENRATEQLRGKELRNPTHYKIKLFIL